MVSDETERLEVTVKDLRSVVKCPWCGIKTSKVHDVRRVPAIINHDASRNGFQMPGLIWEISTS